MAKILMRVTTVILSTLILTGIIITGLSACSAAEAGDLPPVSSIDKGNPKLDSQLNKLVEAEEQGELISFAEENNIELNGNKVRVIIECVEGQLDAVSGAITENSVIVETSYKDLLQALVPVSALEKLSEEPGIRLIRMPLELLPGTD
jgi:hypothetical protein